jgi:hypothetical protein
MGYLSQPAIQHEQFFATLQNGVSVFPCGLLEFMMVAFFDQHLC